MATLSSPEIPVGSMAFTRYIETLTSNPSNLLQTSDLNIIIPCTVGNRGKIILPDARAYADYQAKSNGVNQSNPTIKLILSGSMTVGDITIAPSGTDTLNGGTDTHALSQISAFLSVAGTNWILTMPT